MYVSHIKNVITKTGGRFSLLQSVIKCFGLMLAAQKVYIKTTDEQLFVCHNFQLEWVLFSSSGIIQFNEWRVRDKNVIRTYRDK